MFLLIADTRKTLWAMDYTPKKQAALLIVEKSEYDKPGSSKSRN